MGRMRDPGSPEEPFRPGGQHTEPTFDLVRTKPLTRASAQPSAVVWRAPSQIAYVAARGSVPLAARSPVDGASSVDSRGGDHRARRLRRAQTVKFLGALAVVASISAAVYLLASSPGAREESLSWITLGHPQEAGRAVRAVRAKIAEALRN
jgi:hypothetical protein